MKDGGSRPYDLPISGDDGSPNPGPPLNCGLATGEKKMLVIELLCRLSSATQREVTVFCGYNRESPAGRQRQVLRGRMKENPGLARRVEKLMIKL